MACVASGDAAGAAGAGAAVGSVTFTATRRLGVLADRAAGKRVERHRKALRGLYGRDRHVVVFDVVGAEALRLDLLAVRRGRTVGVNHAPVLVEVTIDLLRLRASERRDHRGRDAAHNSNSPGKG